jgi:uncharacterized protein (DUF1330 family)
LEDQRCIAQGARMNESTRYYQVVLIWLKDPPKFARYGELLRPIAHRYGADLELMIAPRAIHGADMQPPDVVNVVYYDHPGGAAALASDPEFAKIVHLRTESIDMVAVGGRADRGSSTTAEDPSRVTYVVELARFGPDGGDGYRRYEMGAEPIMSRYGYGVERRIAVDSSAGLPFVPDVAKVAYFEADGMDRLHRDPSHERIERELYPRAVADSVWVVGSVHPAMAALVRP